MGKMTDQIKKQELRVKEAVDEIAELTETHFAELKEIADKYRNADTDEMKQERDRAYSKLETNTNVKISNLYEKAISERDELIKMLKNDKKAGTK
jgi:hypothetical protein